MELVEVLYSKQRADYWTPLVRQPDGTIRSELCLGANIGPINLVPGEVLDIHVEQQVTNDNDANGWWTDTWGKQSEHWTLPVMVGNSIKMTKITRFDQGLGAVAPDPTVPATTIVPQFEENWDRMTHHLPITRTWPWKVPANMAADWYSGWYIFHLLNFKASPDYWREGATIRVECGIHQRMAIKRFR